MWQQFQVWRESIGPRVSEPEVCSGWPLATSLCDALAVFPMPRLVLCKGRARAGSFSASLEQDRVVGFQVESLEVGRDFIKHVELSRAPWSFPTPTSWWFIPILGTLVPGMEQCTPMSLSLGVYACSHEHACPWSLSRESTATLLLLCQTL